MRVSTWHKWRVGCYISPYSYSCGSASTLCKQETWNECMPKQRSILFRKYIIMRIEICTAKSACMFMWHCVCAWHCARLSKENPFAVHATKCRAWPCLLSSSVAGSGSFLLPFCVSLFFSLQATAIDLQDQLSQEQLHLQSKQQRASRHMSGLTSQMMSETQVCFHWMLTAACSVV